MPRRSPTQGEAAARGLNDQGTGFPSPTAHAAWAPAVRHEASSDQEGDQSTRLASAFGSSFSGWPIQPENDDPNALVGCLNRVPTPTDRRYPWRIEDPDDSARTLHFSEIIAFVETEARYYTAIMPGATREDRLRRSWISGGFYRKLDDRLDAHPALRQTFLEAFNRGLGAAETTTHPCGACGVRLGPEWWLCPMCNRVWLDERGLTKWPVWRCQRCPNRWLVHELWACVYCRYIRVPHPGIAHRAESEQRRRYPVTIHFDNRYVVAGQVMRRQTQLEAGIRRPLTKTEEAALGLTNAPPCYTSPFASGGEPAASGGER